MPDSAAGNTTRSETWSLDAPRPKAPSRSDCGTEHIASSATDGDRRQDEEAHDDARGQRVEYVELDPQEVAQDGRSI